MNWFIRVGAAAIIAGSAVAPAAAVSVVGTDCVSVSDAQGCLFSGNIAPNTVVETEAAYNAYNNTVLSAQPDIKLSYLFKSDDADFSKSGSLSFNPQKSSGTWSTPGYRIDFIAVKAGPNFVLYRLAEPAQAGSWNTFDIPFAKNPRELSHLTFFGTAAVVPEPATWAMLIAGFGLVGMAMRRRGTIGVLG